MDAVEQVIQQYPGLYEEFRRWYCEMSHKHGESGVNREDSVVAFHFELFIDGGKETAFYSNEEAVYERHPPHLIAMRDMALV